MGLMPTAAAVCGCLLGLSLYVCLLRFLWAYSEVRELSVAQYGVAVAYGLVLTVWMGVEAGFLAARLQPRYDSIAEDEQDLVSETEEKGKEGLEGAASPSAVMSAEASVLGIKHAHLAPLRKAAEFSLIMAFLYLCDRTTLVAKGPKYVSPWAFWGVNGAILLLALFTLRGGGTSPSEPVHAHVKPLQRDQTEEWKGWMQIMFVLYHYFAETEIYNAIRMYIAAYVWMTGFGNFSYYYIKKDFTAVRFTQMMWRLNFFVIFVCLTMNNEYMLYYICPMHTFFTWGVFIPLYLCNSLNDSFTVLFGKIVAAFGVRAPPPAAAPTHLPHASPPPNPAGIDVRVPGRVVAVRRARRLPDRDGSPALHP